MSSGGRGVGVTTSTIGVAGDDGGDVGGAAEIIGVEGGGGRGVTVMTSTTGVAGEVGVG